MSGGGENVTMARVIGGGGGETLVPPRRCDDGDRSRRSRSRSHIGMRKRGLLILCGDGCRGRDPLSLDDGVRNHAGDGDGRAHRRIENEWRTGAGLCLGSSCLGGKTWWVDISCGCGVGSHHRRYCRCCHRRCSNVSHCQNGGRIVWSRSQDAGVDLGR